MSGRQDSDPTYALIARVVERITELSPDIKIMLVGAHCRDILQQELGHERPLRATTDVDLALAIQSMNTYAELTQHFQPTGTNDIRYLIAGIPVDLMPFGDIEQPTGEVRPPPRTEPLSVWAFQEVYKASRIWPIGDELTIRLPRVAGYAALKVGSWLDRSAYGLTKDAEDLGTVVGWYADSRDVLDRLYDTPPGNAVLAQEEFDGLLAATHLLGNDVAGEIGTNRTNELLTRWKGGHLDLLARELGRPAFLTTMSRRNEVVAALGRGLGAET